MWSGAWEWGYGVCGVEPGNEATVCVEWSLGMRLRCVGGEAWE